MQRVLLANRTADGTAVDIDPATQTTLAAALVQLQAIAASVDGLEGYNDGVEGKLDTLHTDLGTLDGHVDGLEAAFTTLNAKDYATQTTLAAVLAKIIAAPATEAKQDTLLTAVGLLAKLSDTQPVSAASLPLPSGAATSARQDTGNTSVASIDTKTPALSSGRVPVDGSGVTQPVSGPLTDSQLRASAPPVDQSKVGGTAIDTNSGNKSAGTQRVVLATDQPALTNALLVDSDTGGGKLAGDGRKTVTTAGTAVAIASSTAVKWVTVTAFHTNTDKVAVGTSSVLAASGSQRGFVLAPGQAASFAVANLNTVYVDSRVNGEGVAFAYGT